MHRVSRWATAAIVCALPLAAHAQSGSITTVNWGVLGGISQSTITDVEKSFTNLPAELIDTKRRLALDGGFFVNVPFTSMWSVQGEIHYAQRGVTLIKKSPLNPDDVEKSTFKIDYIDFPFLLRFDGGAPTRRYRPTIFGGANAAYRLRCSFQFATSSTLDSSNDCDEQDGSDTFNSMDFGVVGGAGITANIHQRIVTLQVRYSQALRTITNSTTGTNGYKPKNQSLILMLGYVF